MVAGQRPPSQVHQLRNVGLDLRTPEHKKVYSALLERRLILLTIQNVQLRGALECATGRPYDSFDPQGMSFEDIQEHVAQDMAQGLSIPIKEARQRVKENSETANTGVSDNETSGAPE